jgi:hypothetical protein
MTRTSRLEELRAKYPIAEVELDPFPFLSHDKRYNNGGRSLFVPRPQYEQNYLEYVRRGQSNNYESVAYMREDFYRQGHYDASDFERTPLGIPIITDMEEYREQVD